MTDELFNHRLSEFIVVIRGLAPKDVCQEILDLYREDPNWRWAQTQAGLNLDQRKVKELCLSSPEVCQQSEKHQTWDSKLFFLMAKAKDIYLKTLVDKRGVKHLPEVVSDEGYNLLHYAEGYYFKEHCDEGPNMGRVLTCTLNLSDDHDGGTFRFLRGAFDVRLKAGDAVLFPSSFLFPHEVTQITRGERYAIVTWFH